MPITKDRINISLSRPVRRTLAFVAKRDHMPTATKAARLLELALEIEEDEIFGQIAAERERHPGRFLSHQEVWGK